MAAARDRRQGRLGLWIGLLLLVGLAVFGLWWFMFRETAPPTVDSVANAEARQAAFDQAQEDAEPEEPLGAATQVELPDPDATTEPEGDGAQGDGIEAANPISGLWTIDTSIGTFDAACLQEACGTSFVGFRIEEELVQFGAKTVVGRTPGVSGSMEIAGTDVVAAEFVADMTQLLTDNDTRTGALKSASGGLETDRFPQASFVLTDPIQLGEIPAEGVAVNVGATGDLTVHGVTQRVTVPLTAERQAGLIAVYGTLEGLLLEDFDIPKPSSIAVLSVEEVAALELQFFLRR